jgi:hypothetical protein
VDGKVLPNIAQSVVVLPSHAFHAAYAALNSVLAEIVKPPVVADVIVGMIPVPDGVRVVAYPGIPVGPVGPVSP